MRNNKMSHPLAAALLAASLCGLASPLQGQEAQVRTDARLRITAPTLTPKPVVGRLAAASADTLLIAQTTDAGPDTARIPVAAVSKLEVSLGSRSNAGKGALIGSLIGSGIGLVLGAAAAAACAPNEFLCFGPEIIPVTTILLAGAGAGVGLVIGALTRSERWRAIPVERIQLGPARHAEDGISVGLTLQL